MEALGRDFPIPKLSERALARLEQDAAVAAAIAEQEREESALSRLAAKRAARAMDPEAQQIMVA